MLLNSPAFHPLPRLLTAAETLILEPEAQLEFLQREMDRTLPKFQRVLFLPKRSLPRD